jgi:hypothetical protein
MKEEAAEQAAQATGTNRFYEAATQFSIPAPRPSMESTAAKYAEANLACTRILLADRAKYRGLNREWILTDRRVVDPDAAWYQKRVAS